MKKRIIKLLEDNARISACEIADRLEMKVEEVLQHIKDLEEKNIIRGYKAVIDESMLGENTVRAIIEIKVRPERNTGFDSVAKRLSRFPEIRSLYLVSGGFDMQLEVCGESLEKVAAFVSGKLSTIDGVTSTATHFLLKKYKESGKILHDEEEYERLEITP